MDMQGERPLAITRDQAWAALNDPQVLKACIAGCDKIEAVNDHHYTVAVALKIGPVSARFAGRITLEDVQPPERYTLVFDGQGGGAGFGKGRAQVTLGEGEGGRGCVLAYQVHAQVGGKIAQVGQRLIDGVARSMAEDFFQRFERAMQERHPDAYATPSIAGGARPQGAAADSSPLRAPARLRWSLAAAAAAAALVGLWLWLR